MQKGQKHIVKYERKEIAAWHCRCKCFSLTFILQCRCIYNDKKIAKNIAGAGIFE